MSRHVLRIFAALLLLTFTAACARPPDLVGVDNPRKPAAAVREASKRKIFIATTRQAAEVTAVFFSDKRAPELGLASVTVSIPPVHETGNLERPRRLPPDPEREFAVIEPTVYDNDGAFLAALNRELLRLPPEDRNILFFVHGYNNTVSDSILRLAQFVEDTDYEGVPVLFSWASAAQPAKYVYDLNSALTARPYLAQAADIMARTKARSFDLFAHSMGAFLTMEAIVQAELKGTFNRHGRLKNIMLAAPDIDIDLFRAQLLQVPDRDENIYVFVSADDKALNISRIISGGVERVGAADAAELEGLGVTVIDLSEIEDSSSGTHSKFAGSPEVVRLIGAGLESAGALRSDGGSTQLRDLLVGVPIKIIYF